MRGRINDQPLRFHVFDVEDRIRLDHPLRDVQRRADRILAGMSPPFAEAYSTTGRPGVPPERLLKALLLMALYSVRSERQLGERIATDLLFRWFLDLPPSDDAFDPTTFTHNRQRLDDHALTAGFFAAVTGEAITAGLCSEHFRVDGTLIESFASAKSFRPKAPPPAAPPGGAPPPGGDEPPPSNGFKPRKVEVDFHGQRRTNETHQSRTEPEAKLYRKGRGKEAKLSHMGHVLSENRNGLIVGIVAPEASGTAEGAAALGLIDAAKATHPVKPKTLGADKGFDSGQFHLDLEARGIEPHVPLVKPPRDPAAVPYKKQRPGVEARRRMAERQGTDGYRLSQKCRKKVEECFGWLKTIAGLGRSRTVGRWTLQQVLEVGAAAFHLVRLRTLKPA